MSWEIEHEEVDKAEGVHRFSLIERSVITRDGQPARYKFHIVLGTGMDGASCPHCHQKVDSGMTLQDDGSLKDAKGTELVPRTEALKRVQQLNGFHARMDAYTKRHRATPYKGPKK
jgi:hypothetical protein